MKKKIFTSVFALAFLVTTGYGVNKSMRNNMVLSEIAFTNVEALAQTETEDCTVIPSLLVLTQSKENNHIGSSIIESFRGCKECRLSEGYCDVVIKSLQASQDNDSIAIDIFKKEYEITNMRLYQKEWLLKKNYIDIIQYFNVEKNKKYYCKSKIFKANDPVLLVD